MLHRFVKRAGASIMLLHHPSTPEKVAKVTDFFGKNFVKEVNRMKQLPSVLRFSVVIVSKNIKNLLLLDVNPLLMGIEIIGNVMPADYQEYYYLD